MSTTANESVQIVRHGDKLALVFDESFLKEAGIDETTQLNVRNDGKTISLSRAANVSPEFLASMRRIHSEWAEVFKRLAE